MKSAFVVIWVILLHLPFRAEPQSFRKGFRQFTHQQDYTAAAIIFKKHLDDKYGAGSRYYLTCMEWPKLKDPFALLALDSTMAGAGNRLNSVSKRTARKLARKFKITPLTILDLRRRLERKAIDYMRDKDSVLALDTFLNRSSALLRDVTPYLDSARTTVVNGHLENKDYQTITSIIQHHGRFILPRNFKRSRGLPDRAWKAFQGQYTLCRIDQFAADYPLSFIGRDCWREEFRTLFCKGSAAGLIDFDLRTPWTGMELTVINTVREWTKEKIPDGLDQAELRQLADMTEFYRLLDSARDPESDSTALITGISAYIQRNAPRFSAFVLLKECVQYFLGKRTYSGMIGLLQKVRPLFGDKLPPECHSDFEFQSRARPYIDGLIPILKQKDPPLRQQPLNGVNTVEGDEFSPVLSSDGDTLYFCASGRKDNIDGQDVFVCFRQGNSWISPHPVPAFSGEGDQIPLSITADGRQFLLMIDGKLQISRKTAVGQWQKPETVPLTGLGASGRAVFSADGNTIILEGAEATANAFQGADMDLYYMSRDSGGRWMAPASMGSNINTERQEGNPFLSADGKKLYYTSDGYPGLGESDVFVSTRINESWTRWTRPIYLGKEINNIYNQHGFGYVSDDRLHALFANYGKNGNYGDIWETSLPDLNGSPGNK